MPVSDPKASSGLRIGNEGRVLSSIDSRLHNRRYPSRDPTEASSRHDLTRDRHCGIETDAPRAEALIDTTTQTRWGRPDFHHGSEFGERFHLPAAVRAKIILTRCGSAFSVAARPLLCHTHSLATSRHAGEQHDPGGFDVQRCKRRCARVPSAVIRPMLQACTRALLQAYDHGRLGARAARSHPDAAPTPRRPRLQCMRH